MTALRVSCGCGNEIHARIEWRTREGVAVIRCPVCGATRNADVSTAEFWARYEARRQANEAREREGHAVLNRGQNKES